MFPVVLNSQEPSSELDTSDICLLSYNLLTRMLSIVKGINVCYCLLPKGNYFAGINFSKIFKFMGFNIYANAVFFTCSFKSS